MVFTGGMVWCCGTGALEGSGAGAGLVLVAGALVLVLVEESGGTRRVPQAVNDEARGFHCRTLLCANCPSIAPN